MAAELVVAAEAEQDVSEAYNFYERRRIGLGADSLSKVDACILTIRRMPKVHGYFHQDYRRALLR